MSAMIVYIPVCVHFRASVHISRALCLQRHVCVCSQFAALGWPHVGGVGGLDGRRVCVCVGGGSR